MAELEIRSAQLGDVRFAERLIDLIVMPYEAEAVVPHAGRLIREVCSRGAFDKINAERRRFSVNRGHDLDRVVGRAVSFEPDAEDGLHASVRIASTPLGDETLQLASEGLLDASAGFAIKADQWSEARSLRRIVKAWLHHIAMTPDPAYDGARVLSVRGAAGLAGLEGEDPTHGVTPLLVELRERELELAAAELDRKYGVR